MFKFLLKYKIGILLGAIILVAFFVRVWNIEETFVFKMDQARDISLVQEAYDGGVGELPLLGPRAAKTYLRLGPIFYYFEYLSMLITGNKSPLSVVWPDFIFSLLTIPLFYYFLRQAFSKRISLMTTAVFASSFFLTQYSRFAWNPNSIPFWSLVYFLGLYKLVHSSQSTVRGNLQAIIRGRWLLVATLGYGVASQLHFTAMLAYPLIGVLFIVTGLMINDKNLQNKTVAKNKIGKNSWDINSIVKKSIDYLTKMTRQLIKNGGVFIKNIGWKYWLGAVIILGVLYLPMFLSEIYTNGDNWLQFKYALSGRGKEEFSLYAKLIQSLKLHSEYFWFSLTSVSGGAGKIVTVVTVIIWMIVINLKFKIQNLKSIFNFSIFKDKNKQFKKESNVENLKSKVVNSKSISISQKNRSIFFLLIFIWWVVMFGLYTKLAFNVLKPRYWLLEAPIFFVILAIFIEWGMNWFKQRGKTSLLVIILTGGLVGMNLWATGYWYWSVQKQQEGNFFHWDLKLKDENKISWGQLNKVVNYLVEIAEQTDKDVCFYTTGEYRPVYDYIFKQRGLAEKIRRMSFGSDTNEKCLFVTIDHRQRREIPRIPKRHRDKFEKIDDSQRKIGFVTIWEVSQKSKVKSPKSDIVTVWATSQEGKDQKLKIAEKEEMNSGANTKSQISKVTRNDNSTANKKNEETSNDKLKDKIKKPKRVERVRWKDLFN